MGQINQGRANPMEYMEGMERIDSDILDKVMAARDSYQPTRYTAQDVKKALQADHRGIEDFAALLSPAAEPYLEEMAREAQRETRKHFGNSVYCSVEPLCLLWVQLP